MELLIVRGRREVLGAWSPGFPVVEYWAVHGLERMGSDRSYLCSRL